MIELQQYWQAVHNRIYIECVESKGYGNCRLDVTIECALQKSLPLIENVDLRITPREGESYEEEQQTIIGGEYRCQTVNSTCGLVSEVGCEAERFVPFVVEAIHLVNEYKPQSYNQQSFH